MKKAIVVGATSGIGRGIAKLLAENDYVVGITGRRKNLLEELKNENPARYLINSFDIRDTQNIADHLTELTNDLEGLDLVIISSGTGDRLDYLDFEIEKRTIDTNVSGFTAVADWTFNYFREQKFGHLVNISSVSGLRGNRFAPAYSASKAYQISYFQGLRHKASNLKYSIYITDVRPGFVDTPMAQGKDVFWVASVEKASEQIFKAISSRKKVVYITRRWRFVALIMKMLPEWIYNRI